MLYLHDVWVNWFEGEENGYNVCHFHEWRKDDCVELLDQAPLLKVNPLLFHYIENDLSELPQQLLQDVYQKAYIRKNHERTQVEYCFIVTDGTNILAIDTMGYHIPIRKSRLIPRQEQLVYEMIADQEELEYKFSEDELNKKEHHILSPSPETMRGLTRKERQLKQLLFMALDQLHTTKIQLKSATGTRSGIQRSTKIFKRCRFKTCGVSYTMKRSQGGHRSINYYASA